MTSFLRKEIFFLRNFLSGSASSNFFLRFRFFVSTLGCSPSTGGAGATVPLAAGNTSTFAFCGAASFFWTAFSGGLTGSLMILAAASFLRGFFALTTSLAAGFFSAIGSLASAICSSGASFRASFSSAGFSASFADTISLPGISAAASGELASLAASTGCSGAARGSWASTFLRRLRIILGLTRVSTMVSSLVP